MFFDHIVAMSILSSFEEQIGNTANSSQFSGANSRGGAPSMHPLIFAETGACLPYFCRLTVCGHLGIPTTLLKKCLHPPMKISGSAPDFLAKSNINCCTGKAN